MRQFNAEQLSTYFETKYNVCCNRHSCTLCCWLVLPQPSILPAINHPTFALASTHVDSKSNRPLGCFWQIVYQRKQPKKIMGHSAPWSNSECALGSYRQTGRKSDKRKTQILWCRNRMPELLPSWKAPTDLHHSEVSDHQTCLIASDHSSVCR